MTMTIIIMIIIKQNKIQKKQNIFCFEKFETYILQTS